MFKLDEKYNFKKLTLKGGISLITLIITVVVIIILASVVILNVSGPNGIIHKAALAKEANDITILTEEAGIVKANSMLYNENLNKNNLLEELKKHFNGSIIGNRVIVEDGEYAIYVDEQLKIQVIKNQEGVLAEGELDLIVEVIDGYKIRTTPVIKGKQTYEEYAREILKEKTMNEKIQIFMDGEKYWEEYYGNEFDFTSFEEYMKSKYGEENYPKDLDEYRIKNDYLGCTVDEMLMYNCLVKPDGYDRDNAPVIEVGLEDENSNWYFDYYYEGYYKFGENIFYATENKEYTFYAYDGEQRVTKTVKIDKANITTIDDVNIYNYDSSTGEITGVKEDYKNYITIYGSWCDRQVELKNGLTKLIVPSSINGVIITKIGEGAFAGIQNLIEVVLPDTIVEIKEDAFASCERLTKLNIPDGVTYIGNYAISWTDMPEIFVPKSVENVDIYGFAFTRDTIINCEAESKPSGWHKNWLTYWDGTVTVNWGQTKQ